MAETTLLTDLQRKFLHFLSQEKTICEKFIWTGGTVLAEFYLKHRYSHDIDLFSQEEINASAIGAFLERSEASRIEYQNYLGLHTYFLTFENDEKLKVDFNYYPFPPLENGGKYLGLRYDSLLDLIVNKVQTLGTKPRSRDFIDIYYYSQDYDFDLFEMVKKARLKFDWHIDNLLLAANLSRAGDISDAPLLTKSFDEDDYKSFYLSLIDQLKGKTAV